MDSNNDTYKPVSCDLHSQYELAIMHKSKLHLTYQSENHSSVSNIVTPTDVQTKNKAEYLIAVTSRGENLCIRLDHIIEMRILS